MDRLLDRLKELGNRILEWWNRFTTKQKTLIVMVVSAVVLTLVIIVTILNRPKYALLVKCEDIGQAAEVNTLLTEEDFTFHVSEDGLEFEVLESQHSDAVFLLGANNIPSVGYGIENVINNGFSTTESDKQRAYLLYQEKYLEDHMLELFSAVKSADVTLHIPDSTGLLADADEESYATVVLELRDEFSADNAAYLARAIATGIGNTTTDNIVIMDTNGNLLFTADETYNVTDTTTDHLTIKSEVERLVNSQVKQALTGTNMFDRVEVVSNLVLDFSTSSTTEHAYTPAEGQEQGVLSSAETFSSTAQNGVSGIPGTDSNGEETTYVLENDGTTNSETMEQVYKYLPNERITTIETPAGMIDYSQSTIAVTAFNYNIVREKDVKAQGLLDGVTWEEYQLANGGRTKLEVDEDMIDVVARATGVSSSNVAIIAYSENMFFDDSGIGIKATDVLQILLIIIILALLAFVVIRSMRGEKHEEQEEELSVETLLQSTTDVLEDITPEAENETKRLVDKFVEENPEAAANLLRNWLNEDWG